jgi:tripartite-type tricarboxylate transporter receptor subunit TctC
VPFRATSDITVALLAGNIDYLCNQYSNIAEQIRAAQVKAFAVSADRRLPQLPEVPTAAEAGLPDFKVNAWFALQAPKGTPSAIITMLNRALDKALDDALLERRMADLGIDPAPKDKRGREWLAPFIRSEIASGTLCCPDWDPHDRADVCSCLTNAANDSPACVCYLCLIFA